MTDLYKEAGALGVYSQYCEDSKENFSQVKLRSPIKGGDAHELTHSLDTSPSRPVSTVTSPRDDAPSPTPEKQAQKTAVPVSVAYASSYSPIDLLHTCLGSIVGKDKAAKTVIYLLRLLGAQYAVLQGLGYAFDEKLAQFNIAKILLSPRLLLLFVLHQIVSRSEGVVSGLGLFRQVMRSCQVPFHVIKVVRLARQSLRLVSDPKLSAAVRVRKMVDFWFNWNVITTLATLYYAWADESLLVYKLGILGENEYPQYHELVTYHELVAWMATILTGLRNDYARYREVLALENKARLAAKVRARARKILADSESDSDLPEDIKLTEELGTLSKEKWILKVDMVRLSCDMIYDTVSLSGKKMYPPLLLSFGLGSGSLGFYKVWLQEKMKLLA